MRFIRCEFTPTTEPGRYRCRRCGFVLHSPRFGPDRIRRQCDAILLERPSDRGLGDTLARWLRPMARLLGLEECGGCRRRQNWLNRWLPYTLADRLPLDRGTPPAVLLRFPHGLGDCVQLTTVLLHLRQLVPDWQIDVASRPGTQSCFAGLCRAQYVLGQEPPDDYDLARTLHWYEPHTCYADSPATKAERCLREVFNVQPQPELCRYEIAPSAAHHAAAAAYLASIGSPTRYAVLHYQGHTTRRNKDLKHQQAGALVEYLRSHDVAVILLDWDARSRLVSRQGVYCPGRDHALWGDHPGGDAGAVAALCAQASLCVGIDSGPGHIMGAIDTPTIIAWTHHHPLHYFGHAEHVTHLVPMRHAEYLRGSPEDQAAGRAYFAEHYDWRIYQHLATALTRTAAEKLQPSPYRVAGDHWIRRAHDDPDYTIVRDVYLEDAYRVAELPLKPATAVDVGACFGAFATRLRAHSSRTRIACVEAHPANEPLLRRNTADLDVSLYCPRACTYEAGELALLSTLYDGTENTGGSLVAAVGSERWADEQHPGSVYRTTSVTVQPITLEEIAAAEGWPSIDLLKLDCEGSEFSILEQADLDGLGVRMIVGEWHDRQRMIDLVARRFAGWNWRVMLDDEYGLFWLWR